MKIYFSIDPEVSDLVATRAAKKLLNFLQKQGHIVFRAPYALAKDPDFWLRKSLHFKKTPSFAQQREIHVGWIDKADLLVADISDKSEGMVMIIQRALDKPLIGLNFTPIILLKNKNRDRKFGRIVKGLIESGRVVFFEYDSIDNVVKNWQYLVSQAQKNSKINVQDQTS